MVGDVPFNIRKPTNNTSIAAQNAISTNYIKAKTANTQENNTSSLPSDKHEKTVNHIDECKKLAQKD